MCYIGLNVKVNLMSDPELFRRREEIYSSNPKSTEKEREQVYMELGLIELRIDDVYAPIQELLLLFEVHFQNHKRLSSFQSVPPPI